MAICQKLGGAISSRIEAETNGFNHMDFKTRITIDLGDGEIELIKTGMSGMLQSLELEIVEKDNIGA